MFTRKKAPRGVYYVAGVHNGTRVQAFCPPGAMQKKSEKKKHAYSPWEDLFVRIAHYHTTPHHTTPHHTIPHRKKTHASHTQQQHCSSKRCWSCRNPAAPRRRPAPIKAQTTTQTLGRSLRRPGQAAPTREGTPASGPAPATASAAQQVLQRGPLPRVCPPSFELERWVGPRGGTPTRRRRSSR